MDRRAPSRPTSTATTTLIARCAAWIAWVSLPIVGTTEPSISGKSPNARPACWPVTHEPSSIWAKIATAVTRRGGSGPAARGRPASVRCVARSAMKIDRRQDGERHRQVRRDELGGEALQHDRSPEQRLDDDEDAGHDRGGEQRAVVATRAEDRDQPDGARPADRRRPPRRADGCARSRRGGPPAAASRRSRAASPGSRGPSPWRARARPRRSGRRSPRQRQPRAWRIGSSRRSSRPLRLRAMPSGRCPS